MKTPCIAACKNNGGICQGCKRTMDEIVKWQHVTEDEREDVMNALSGKSSTHSCPSCGKPAQCDISAGKETCWCFELEKRELPKSDSDSLCYCRECLANLPIQ